MAGLDPRFGPPAQNRTVTVEYLDELYDKADELRLLKAYLATLQIDIGGFDAWRSRRSTSSSSHLRSEHGSTESVAETDRLSSTHRHERPHSAVF